MNSLELAFALAVLFTIGVSAFCSLLEAMILSVTTAEIEALKQRSPRRGKLLATFKEQIEETTSAILTLNTVANTAGASASGALAIKALGDGNVALFTGAMTLAILIFSEILPKNIGVLYRPILLPIFVDGIRLVRMATKPVSYSARHFVRLVAGKTNESEGNGNDEEEIILLAEKGAEDGNLTETESTMIANALSLDEVRVYEIMTPRTVVMAYEQSETIAQILDNQKNIPFARMPVYQESIDKIVGLARRRDILKAAAEDRDTATIGELMRTALIIPDNATGAHALQQFLKVHQQLAVVVDEFGSVSGVVTMEDIMEHILGQEIFERDDMAVDMRELARRRERVRARKKAREQHKAEPVEG